MSVFKGNANKINSSSIFVKSTNRELNPVVEEQFSWRILEYAHGGTVV